MRGMAVFVFVVVLVVGWFLWELSRSKPDPDDAAPCGAFPECKQDEGCRGCAWESHDGPGDGRPRAFGGAA